VETRNLVLFFLGEVGLFLLVDGEEPVELLLELSVHLGRHALHERRLLLLLLLLHHHLLLRELALGRELALRSHLSGLLVVDHL
jgi:hypothetical protein